MQDLIINQNNISEKCLKTVVGQSAPAGYYRFVNSADAAKLAGINSRDVQRIRVKTAVVRQSITQYEGQIKTYINANAQWAPGDMKISIDNTADSVELYQDIPPQITLCGTISPYPRGNEIVTVKIMQGSKTVSASVVCRVAVTTAVAVAKTKIIREDLLTGDNCEMQRKDITTYRMDPITDPAALAGLKALRTIAAGTIIGSASCKRKPVIEKNDPVSIAIRMGTVRVMVEGTAREEGSPGEMIWVENSATHKLIKTRVLGSGRVELNRGVL